MLNILEAYRSSGGAGSGEACSRTGRRQRSGSRFDGGRVDGGTQETELLLERIQVVWRRARHTQTLRHVLLQMHNDRLRCMWKVVKLQRSTYDGRDLDMFSSCLVDGNQSALTERSQTFSDRLQNGKHQRLTNL